MPYVAIEGRRVHYRARDGVGGRAIVFLHGGFGSSSELWESTMARLPREWSAYAIDNFLDSEPPPDGYNVQAFARRASLFSRALELSRPVYAGHSMGGVVCQLVGINDSDNVGGLVLICTGASTANNPVARPLLEALKTRGVDALATISANWFHKRVPEFFAGYVANAARAPLDAMIAVQESLIATDLRSELGRIAAPTLIVFGAYDTGRTFEHAQTLLDGIRGSILARMDDSGHSPMIETPAAFDLSLHRFLNEIAGRHTKEEKPQCA